jgi:hypothetical protein
MSEQELPVPQEEQIVDPRPEDVKQLAKIAGEFAEMHRAVMEGQFPGKASKVVDKLVDHLRDMYKQSYDQLLKHPWILEQQAKKAQEG